MANGELQTEPKKKRISHVKKGIQRTLSTAAFETVVIFDHVEEDIEWETLEERQRKMENWEAILLQNFKRFHDVVLKELNLEQKCAYTKTAQDKKTHMGGKKLDDLLENLDDLDALDMANEASGEK